MPHALRLIAAGFVSMAMSVPYAHAQNTPLTSPFSYQGLLKSGGSPFTGTADIRYTLFDALTGGTMQGTYDALAVSVSEGAISMPVDLGSASFDGNNRYLQIAVRFPAGSGGYTTLSPRQKITPTPYALFAIRARGIYSTENGQSVGIGTSVPAAKLEVRDGDFLLGTFNEQWLFHSRSSFGSDFLQITDSDGGVPQFQRGLVLHQNGNVGIGTTAPTSRLEIAATDGLAITGLQPFITLRDTNSSGARTLIANNFGDLKFFPDSFIGGPPAMMIRNRTGCLAIGTTTPNSGYRLHVVGSIRGDASTTTGINGTTSGTLGSGSSAGIGGTSIASTGGGVGVRGNSSSSSGYDFYATGVGVDYGTASSIRWKQNITPIADPLDRVEQIRGVWYDWDAAHGGRHDVGMIAEEVGKVMPEIVAYESNGIDASGMDYGKLTPLLVEAVKALRAEKDVQIERLRAEKDAQVEMLQQENLDLRDRMAALEAAVAGLNN